MILLYVVIGILFLVSILQTVRYNRQNEFMIDVLMILGYYRVRFGDVTREDIENNVGITPEKIRRIEQEENERIRNGG